MGNSASLATWADLKVKKNESNFQLNDEIAAKIMLRLNVLSTPSAAETEIASAADSNTNANNNNNNNNDSINDDSNESKANETVNANAAETGLKQQQLMQYLSSLSLSELENAIEKFGVQRTVYPANNNGNGNGNAETGTDTGTQPMSADNKKQYSIQVLLSIAHPQFWVQNYAMHPNSSRVKNWLFVHSRYRLQMKALVTEVNKVTDAQNKAHMLALSKMFNKFDQKIIGHTEFEDKMLFKFLKENVTDSVPNLDVLLQQHKNEFPNKSKKIAQCFLGYSSNSENTDIQPLRDMVNDYCECMDAHMQMEEESIVYVWLNLSEELYKTYRTYLSWKFSVMY